MLAKILVMTSILLSLTANASDLQNEPFCYDADKIFKGCRDQFEIYKEANIKALREEKRILLVYGFESCPWSNSIVKALFFSNLAADIHKKFVVTMISSRFSPTGKSLATYFQEKFKQPEAAGWGVPQLYIIEPLTEKGVILNMAPYERNTDETQNSPAYRGYDVESVVKAIEVAIKNI